MGQKRLKNHMKIEGNGKVTETVRVKDKGLDTIGDCLSKEKCGEPSEC